MQKSKAGKDDDLEDLNQKNEILNKAFVIGMITFAIVVFGLLVKMFAGAF